MMCRHKKLPLFTSAVIAGQHDMYVVLGPFAGVFLKVVQRHLKRCESLSILTTRKKPASPLLAHARWLSAHVLATVVKFVTCHTIVELYFYWLLFVPSHEAILPNFFLKALQTDFVLKTYLQSFYNIK
jgi:hypothetical protein